MEQHKAAVKPLVDTTHVDRDRFGASTDYLKSVIT